MARTQRAPIAPARGADLSNLGKTGRSASPLPPARDAQRKRGEPHFTDTVNRRTGIELPPQKIDHTGMEETAGLFSSPNKQKGSPLKQVFTASGEEDVEEGMDASATMSGINSTF